MYFVGQDFVWITFIFLCAGNSKIKDFPEISSDGILSKIKVSDSCKTLTVGSFPKSLPLWKQG